MTPMTPASDEARMSEERLGEPYLVALEAYCRGEGEQPVGLPTTHEWTRLLRAERTALTNMTAECERKDAALEAAVAHMEAWDAMEEAVEYRREVLHEETQGQVVSDQWKAELAAQVREANAVEHRTADILRDALAALNPQDTAVPTTEGESR